MNHIEKIKKLSEQVNLDNISEFDIKLALRIRLVEQAFLRLFSEGKMNGTVHTCVGQEFSAVSVCKNLNEDDWVTSNHRCHGHFISKTRNWKGLIDELIGVKTGVSRGIGSSQHLYSKGFLSNGIQASLLPVGTGIALYKKINKEKNIVVSFLGEGTLGEGASYEAFNLAVLHNTPQLFVCENNFYSQSTPQVNSITGNILKRPESFGMRVFEANTWEIAKLNEIVAQAIEYVRDGSPAFLNISTYRLNAHSKGDDDRDLDEIQYFHSKDPLNLLLERHEWSKERDKLEIEINKYINNIEESYIDEEFYCKDQLPRHKKSELINFNNSNVRMVSALNKAYSKALENGAFLIGEDIMDPYGGAFKVTKGFSSEYPNQVFYSSISESGMVGVSIGMALMGVKSFTEIMFGDFMTLTFDQVINNASKMYHMYAFQNSVPIRIRTPMGGKRGYGPTHSQSLEKFFLGIDNVLVISLTSMKDPLDTIIDLENIYCPVIIIENKLDYSRFLWAENKNYSQKIEDRPFGNIVLSPKNNQPTLTIVSYGESARHIADNIDIFFEETDQIPELICLTKLHPIDYHSIEKSLSKTNQILIVEDGSTFFGLGSEILANLTELSANLEFAYRIGADPYPIPSVSKLEERLLPTIKTICSKFLKAYNNK